MEQYPVSPPVGPQQWWQDEHAERVEIARKRAQHVISKREAWEARSKALAKARKAERGVFQKWREAQPGRVRWADWVSSGKPEFQPPKKVRGYLPNGTPVYEGE